MRVYQSTEINIDELTIDINNEYEDKDLIVRKILKDVRLNKDKACLTYTRIFDSKLVTNLRVEEKEIEKAFENINEELISDLKKAYSNILDFHKLQLQKEYFIKKKDSKIGQIIRPIETVGMYVPGGTASYPSTVLMNAAPAKIAGVKNLIMITPPNEDGTISDILLVAASIAGVDQIYKIGGAQGIAALAYGTETIPKVDKIVGPGNIYVALAKKQVNGIVGIDMIAGPSEVVVIADENANPKYIAADLLAQAEHDVLAKPILLTNSPTIAKLVQAEIKLQVNKLSRKDIALESIEEKGFIIITKTISQAIEISNAIAPEHLELQCDKPEQYVPFIMNAGAIFIGEYTPEPVGDYFAGPNHTLPTSGNARFNSALNTNDFIKTISYIKYSKRSLWESKESIIRIANEEGLTAHANAVKVRFDL